MTRLVLITLCALAASCGAVGGGQHPDATILPGSAAATLLHQCSRGVPAKGEGVWRPGWADVEAMETALRQALRTEPRLRDIKGAKPPDGWLRQYVGVVRGGERFIYGNYLPKPAGLQAWRTQPAIVCDGGPVFFGAEYDVRAKRISHLAFNGGF